MIEASNILLIGSAGRNSGKTTLACKVIDKFSKQRNIYAVKITTITETSKCPRGGKGCGVCSSMKGSFEITKETNPKGNKDTSRLLASGAKKVLWLRAKKDHLSEGLKALIKKLPKNTPLICESNSAAQYLKPSVFLLAYPKDIKNWKESALSAKPFADKLISFSNNKINFSLNNISFVKDRWILKLNATAIILAGGKSKRMGFDKTQLKINGVPIIEHLVGQLSPLFKHIIINKNSKASLNVSENIKVVSDIASGKGPLMGIYSSVKHSRTVNNFVMACDVPQINISLVNKLYKFTKNHDIVLPCYPDDKTEPLFAFYKTKTLPVIEKVLEKNIYKIDKIFPSLKVKYLEIDESEKIPNLNTLADYKKFKQKRR